jgi:hypothetical protein
MFYLPDDNDYVELLGKVSMLSLTGRLDRNALFLGIFIL